MFKHDKLNLTIFLILVGLQILGVAAIVNDRGDAQDLETDENEEDGEIKFVVLEHRKAGLTWRDCGEKRRVGRSCAKRSAASCDFAELSASHVSGCHLLILHARRDVAC